MILTSMEVVSYAMTLTLVMKERQLPEFICMSLNFMSKFTSMKLQLNTFLTKSTQLSYLLGIRYFGLQFSVTWPVYGNVKEESLP